MGNRVETPAAIMSRPFTVEQVAAHNQTTVLDKWWAIIHGEVYRVSNIPLAKCKTRTSFHL